MDDMQAENTLHAIPRSKFLAVRNQLLTCMTSEPAEREREFDRAQPQLKLRGASSLLQGALAQEKADVHVPQVRVGCELL